MQKLCDNSKVKLRGHFSAPDIELLSTILSLIIQRDQNPIPFVKEFSRELEDKASKAKAWNDSYEYSDVVMSRAIRVSLSIYEAQRGTIQRFLKAYIKAKMGGKV